MTFRAVWEPIRYRIIYDTAGGINNSLNPSSFTIEDEIALLGTVKEGVRFWTWQQVGGKFINTIPAGTTHDVILVARYQKDQETDNIGGAGGGSGGGSGRGVSGRRGTVGGSNGNGNGNNSAGLDGGAQLATQLGSISSTADGADASGTAKPSSQTTEPNSQNNTATSDAINRATSRAGSKMRSAQSESGRSKARRLPKTGEAGAADGLRGAALGLLLAGFAVRRKREEQ